MFIKINNTKRLQYKTSTQLKKYIWRVAGINTIECADYDGRERRVLRQTPTKVYGILIEDDFVYWAGKPEM